MNNPNLHINPRDFSPAQQELIFSALRRFTSALVQAVPRLGPAFLSGGTLEIKTLAGVNLKWGMEPLPGGLINPGGINPHTPPKGGFILP
jgi:hypothetical protein